MKKIKGKSKILKKMAKQLGYPVVDVKLAKGIDEKYLQGIPGKYDFNHLFTKNEASILMLIEFEALTDAEIEIFARPDGTSKCYITRGNAETSLVLNEKVHKRLVHMQALEPHKFPKFKLH